MHVSPDNASFDSHVFHPHGSCNTSHDPRVVFPDEFFYIFCRTLSSLYNVLYNIQGALYGMLPHTQGVLFSMPSGKLVPVVDGLYNSALAFLSGIFSFQVRECSRSFSRGSS